MLSSTCFMRYVLGISLPNLRRVMLATVGIAFSFSFLLLGSKFAE
jgi:hypothetical protein